MGVRDLYHLNQAILSIYSEDGRRSPMMIPSGATVIQDGPLDGLRLIDVVWEGKTVMLFSVDLRARATLIPAPVLKVS